MILAAAQAAATRTRLAASHVEFLLSFLVAIDAEMRLRLHTAERSRSSQAGLEVAKTLYPTQECLFNRSSAPRSSIAKKRRPAASNA